MKRQDRITKLIVVFLILNTIGGLVLAWFMYSFISDPSSAFNRNLAMRIQSVVGQFRPLDGIKGEKGDKGDDGISITGPQGPKGDNGESIVGPQGNNGYDGNTIQGPKGDQGEPGPTGPSGNNSPQASFRCDSLTEQLQYKYPIDEDWTNVGATCVPKEGNTNAVRK